MSFWLSIKKIALSPYFQAVLLLVICAAATAQAVRQDEIANFMIFKTATQRFFSHANPYDFIGYNIIWDKFLYSPTFCLLFYPFSLLPNTAAIFIWLLLGAMLFLYAIRKLPLSESQKAIVFFIALIDLVNSLQNLQTNALNTAFMILIFVSFHNNKTTLAALFTTLCLTIKIYPAASALLFLFYPNKVKFLLSAAVFALILFCAPFLVVSSDYYLQSLQNWYHTLADDTNIFAIWKSPSLIGINYTWFPQTLNHFYLQLGGLLLVFLPLVKLLKKQVDLHFILLYLALIMIFVVIFNHAAESPTYVIAVTGAAIWYAVADKSLTNNNLLILLFVACILLPTDIYPRWLRLEYFMPLKIRVIPVFVIWLKILFDLLSYKPRIVAAT